MEIIDQTKDTIRVMKTANRYIGSDLIAIPVPKLETDPIDDDNPIDYDKINEKDESDKKM